MKTQSFTSAQICRAMAAVRKGGSQVTRIDIEPGGKMSIMVGPSAAEKEQVDALDTELAEHRRKHGSR